MKDDLSVLVALSGGVDSSASLALLCKKRDSAEVKRLEAAYIKTWMHETDPIGECSWKEDIADCTAVCEKLGVPFRVVNLMEEYQAYVVKMLIEGYARGITPNPDIACNRYIKFGAFLQFALKEGFTHLATGHYAQVKEISEGIGELSSTPNPLHNGGDNTVQGFAPQPQPRSCGVIPPEAGQSRDSSAPGGFSTYHLLEGADPNKDQSYFLAQLTQDQLAHAIFPIGGLLKPEVRNVAEKFGLPNASKKDSQGICFLGKVKINDFLRRYLPDHPGAIVNHKGEELGQHKGLHHYTIGQRHGMGIPSNAEGEHYVVVAKDFSTNVLRVAFDHAETPGLYQTSMRLHNIHWLNKPKPAILEPLHATSEIEILARPRYRDPKVPAILKFDETKEAGEGTLTFSTPQRALASGQLVAFHLGTELIGSGVYL